MEKRDDEIRVLASMPLETGKKGHDSTLPASVIHYVIRAKENIVLDNASQARPVYFRSIHYPKSNPIHLMPADPVQRKPHRYFISGKQSCNRRIYTPTE